MRLAFVDPGPLVYDLDSPGEIPLGGSESALCHLARALSESGHEVYFLKGNRPAHWSGRVRVLALEPRMVRDIRPLDALVVLNAAGYGPLMRASLGQAALLVLWIHQAADQPVLKPLGGAEVRGSFDAFACVSRWQADLLVRVFGLEPARVGVMRNAVAPWFSERFEGGGPVRLLKDHPPVLAYTSTPYRGLDLLLDLFPQIRRQVPETRLRVYSSMRVYQMAESDEARHFAELYRKSHDLEGVEYVGSVSQRQLAAELRRVSVLAYPNTYAETSCISALEAMAAGCRVVTSDLAALPETTAGFAELVPTDDWNAYGLRFVERTVQVLSELPDAATQARLAEQLAFVRREYTWARRVEDWTAWLPTLPRRAARPASMRHA